jgi:SAM-dependent methyltransferase
VPVRSHPDDDERRRSVVEQSKWVDRPRQDPNHSTWYIERFRAMAAAGDDLDGEARFVDAMVPRRARILDAGCGPGRVGAELARRGHDVVGVDVDPVLIAAAEADHPGATWVVGDLAELDLAGDGIAPGFDVVVCAGNVMTFLAPSTRRGVLSNLRDQLADTGRIVVGFGAGRDYDFDEFRADATRAGLVVEVELATWDLRPFHERSEFLVAILRRGPRGEGERPAR